MATVLQAKDAADWVYRGEGAVNLVLAYCGSSPNFVGKVLRIQKVPNTGPESENGHTVLTIHEGLVWREYEGIVSAPTRDTADQLYVQKVICPLLGSEHVDAGIRVLASKKFLEAIEKKVLHQRPSWRVDAGKINVMCDSVLLIADHSTFPCGMSYSLHRFNNGNLGHAILIEMEFLRPHVITNKIKLMMPFHVSVYSPVSGVNKEDFCVSVEIKPKGGFLPISEFIAEENTVKRRISRFKMHQALKFHQGKISQVSKYDPLDMFSGSKDRVHKAIESLFHTPQNNFRVFLNGSLIFGSMGGSSDKTGFMVNQAFEDGLKHVILAKDGMHIKYVLELVAEIVMKSGLLNRLLEIQKLDALDIEGAIHHYYDAVSKPCMVCQEKGGNKLSPTYSKLHSMPRDEKLKVVRDYLIAATAKDISMMITFRAWESKDTTSSRSSVFLESTNQYFDYKVSFVDLDMKPLEKMEYYYQLDQKIVSHYCNMIKDKEGIEYPEAAPKKHTNGFGSHHNLGKPV